MNASRNLPPEERRLFLRRAALAPLCLCLVAGLHVARVWTARQTPWKGGGFGMFSTVDSEANRFLRAYLITDGRELPLELPAALDKRAAEQRAAPSGAGLSEVARRLATHQWRWSDDRQRQQAAAIAACQRAPVSASSLTGRGFVAPAAEPAIGQTHFLEPVPLDQSSALSVEFRAVRVECWRLRFDPVGQLLRAEPMLSATVDRREEQP